MNKVLGKFRQMLPLLLIGLFVLVSQVCFATDPAIPSDYSTVTTAIKTWFAAAAVSLLAVLVAIKLIKMVPRALAWFMGR